VTFPSFTLLSISGLTSTPSATERNGERNGRSRSSPPHPWFHGFCQRRSLAAGRWRTMQPSPWSVPFPKWRRGCTWSSAERLDWIGGGAPASLYLTGTAAQGRRPPLSLIVAAVGYLGQFLSLYKLSFYVCLAEDTKREEGEIPTCSHLPKAWPPAPSSCLAAVRVHPSRRHALAPTPLPRPSFSVSANCSFL
jgi:hypothetical protein